MKGVAKGYPNMEKYGITQKDVAGAMGYKTMNSYYGSRGRVKHLDGIEEILGKVRVWYKEHYLDMCSEIFDE